MSAGFPRKGFFDALPDADALMEFARWRRKKAQEEKVPVLIKGPISPTVAFIVVTPEPDKAPIRDALQGQTVIYVHGRSRYFSEGRWMNEGIKQAMGMDTKWIVLMSDDLYEVTPIERLEGFLASIDSDTAWIDPFPDYYHSYEAYLAKRHPLENVLGRDHLKLGKLCEKFSVETVIGSRTPIHKPFHFYAFSKLFPRPCVGPSFRMTSDFCILSAEWCRKQGNEVLNELFCGWEDCDLSMRLRNARSTTIDFRIGSSIGGTLGIGFSKALRELFNLSIFNSLLREGRYG